jgi:hypothetical protein
MEKQMIEQPGAGEPAKAKLELEVTDFEGPYEDLDDAVVFTRSTTTSCSTS